MGLHAQAPMSRKHPLSPEKSGYSPNYLKLWGV